MRKKRDDKQQQRAEDSKFEYFLDVSQSLWVRIFIFFFSSASQLTLNFSIYHMKCESKGTKTLLHFCAFVNRIHFFFVHHRRRRRWICPELSGEHANAVRVGEFDLTLTNPLYLVGGWKRYGKKTSPYMPRQHFGLCSRKNTRELWKGMKNHWPVRKVCFIFWPLPLITSSGFMVQFRRRRITEIFCDKI